jgi:hypothetical protein
VEKWKKWKSNLLVPLFHFFHFFHFSPNSQCPPRGDLRTAAPAAERVKRLLEREACLDGARRLLTPAYFHAKAFEAQRSGTFHQRIVLVGLEAVPRFPRTAGRAQHGWCFGLRTSRRSARRLRFI